MANFVSHNKEHIVLQHVKHANGDQEHRWMKHSGMLGSKDAKREGQNANGLSQVAVKEEKKWEPYSNT